MENNNPDFVWKELSEQPWLLTELAGKVFKQAVCASNDGMLQVTIEFEDLSQISILMKSKQVVSFETARLEDGDLTDIRPARPHRRRSKTEKGA